MNLAALAEAIHTRLTGDSSLVTLLPGGIKHWYNPTAQPENAPLMHAVFTIDIGGHEHSTRGELWDMDVTVTVSMPRATSFVDATSAVERIHGDATTRADLTPSIGLHRWTPSLSGGTWTAGIMVCIDGSSLTTEADWLHYSLVYRCRLSREAPTS